MADNNTIRKSSEIRFFLIPMTGLIIMHLMLCSTIAAYWDSFMRVYVWLIYNMAGVVNRVTYSIVKKDPSISEFITALNTLDAIITFTTLVLIVVVVVAYFVEYKGELIIKNSGSTRVIVGSFAAVAIFGQIWMHYFVCTWSQIFSLERDRTGQ
jgi:hypothetical protein